jgi:quinol monooxygenase YgiN
MKLFVFAASMPAKRSRRCCARPELIRAEPGCREMGACRSVRDPRLFFIHSRWADEAAFDVHVNLPNTDRFVDCAEQLIDHPFDVARSHSIEE